MATTSLPLPTGTYQLPEPRASVRRLVNCFIEQAPQDSSIDSKAKDPPVILRRAPGIETWCTLPDLNFVFAIPPKSVPGPVRGMCMMAGVLYVVSASDLYSVDSQGNATQLGSGIFGSGRVHMTGNGYCLVIILPAYKLGYTWTVGGSLLPISSSTFTTYGALNVGFIDSYIVFLQQDGRGFYNDDGQITSGTGPITFNNFGQFPREYGTDPFVGMGILDRVIWMFGQLTTEAYIDAGNTAGSPFASAPNNFIEIGCAAGETITKCNQTLYFIANDLTVRALNGTTPVRVSNHAIEAILQTMVMTDAYGLAYSLGGHQMIAFTFPTSARTLVYDATTTEWHEMESYGYGYWRPYCQVNAYGLQLLGDSQNTGFIGQLSQSVYSEYGTPMVATWIHQPIYGMHNRIRHRRLELMLGTGESAPLTGQGSDPLITLKKSDDGGHTWRTLPTKSLGSEGKRLTRVQWWNLGMARERVYQFNLSDPVALWLTDATLEVYPSKH